MPVITFMKDIFYAFKSPYHRTVGRVTEKLCQRADRRAKSPLERKIYLIAVVCADECLASLLHLDEKEIPAALAECEAKKKLNRRQVAAAVRYYLSLLLLLATPDKEKLLTAVGLDESAFLQKWCQVFEYTPQDRMFFDQDLPDCFRREGSQGAVKLVLEFIRQLVLEHPESITPAMLKLVGERLRQDVQALSRAIRQGGEKNGSH